MANLSSVSVVHEKVQIVMIIENGQVTGVCKVRDGELIASMDTFIRLAERAGYQITAPAQEETGGINSNTHS
ncbi:hypothetical protein ABL778_002950 [Escherichia coli]|uniref:hypothetical protein n=1 Tax=Escherichia coli TaxID=562 RepID=UPI000390C74F|nr:hypothetical protein [Escherichia coli]EEX3604117.1 hypothetical protein [Escherichia coli O157:H7]API37769.1 hypothetical protein BFL17_13060 [Escherichia coli]EEC7478597.1 hypothetical protein [Escherichia coli]EEC7678501.1 hypothetical protein [Escherichia coli]EEC7753789.1 hypothetical protein [Escherichia coli]